VAPQLREKRLTEKTLSTKLKNMEYAVRGPVVNVANEIEEEIQRTLEEGTSNPYSFDKILYTNIGNPHSVGQQPLTWPRQVMALCDLPEEVGINHPDVEKMFPSDAIERAREIKKSMGGYGTGAYTHSQGIKAFRNEIAKFIEERDNVDSDPDQIFITNGASAAISMVLTALIKDSSCGVMIPTPQYPIYSATIDLLGGQKVGYHLDESKNWDMNIEELERSLEEAKSNGINVNSLVLINPGNPTGQVLSRKSMVELVKFCAKHNLVLLADEVYQVNVYDENSEFVSAKRAAYEAGLLENDEIEIFSFHSTSKGLFGECGRRGGYMELTGVDPYVKDMLYKLASSELCSGVAGQIMTSIMVRGPPKDGESYETFESEKKAVLESLRRRSSIVSKGLDSIPGFSCQTAQGSMYCFPSVEISENAIKVAESRGVSPDTLYALSLLKSTGICVVPASGFGQKAGRFGFRTTFLPSEEDMAKAVTLFAEHHKEFNEKYG